MMIRLVIRWTSKRLQLVIEVRFGA